MKITSIHMSLLFFFFFNFILFFKLYIIVLVLPNIKMNLPQVYMCFPSWTLLPPPSPFHPSGSSQCTSPSIQYHASNLDWQLFSYFLLLLQVLSQNWSWTKSNRLVQSHGQWNRGCLVRQQRQSMVATPKGRDPAPPLPFLFQKAAEVHRDDN